MKFSMEAVISEDQRALNEKLHMNEKYGNRPDSGGLSKHLPAALARMHELGICDTVLDYGTGKGALVKRLIDELPKSIQVSGYDPAVMAYSKRPKNSVDILTCFDVLEHIELQNIDAVLQDIKNLTKKFCFLVIDLQPAVKTLADGRNAHILLAPQDWWVNRIAQLFPCQASFPIMHLAGKPQRIVIAACQDQSIIPLMYGFILKLKLHGKLLRGGVLEKSIIKTNKTKKNK